MNKKYFILILVIIILSLIIYFIFTYKEPKLKQIEVEQKNNIINFTNDKYYDTILHVGLNILNIENVDVVVNRIHEKAKEDFLAQGGILGAHLKELNENYYLYIDALNKNETITVLSHELIHLEQYHSDKLIYKNDTLIWFGKKFGRTELPYESRPWEIDAYKRERELASKIRELLIESQ